MSTPNTAAVTPHLHDSLEEQSAYGLDCLLDGMTRDVPARTLGPGQPGRQPTAAHEDGDAGAKVS